MSDYFKQQHIPPFVKNLFIGKFDKSLLSYAEVLNDKSFLQLEEKVNSISDYLKKNQTLIDKIDKTSKIHPDFVFLYFPISRISIFFLCLEEFPLIFFENGKRKKEDNRFL